MNAQSYVRAIAAQNAEGLAIQPAMAWMVAIPAAATAIFASSPPVILSGAVFFLLTGIAAAIANAEMASDDRVPANRSHVIAMISAVQAVVGVWIAAATGSLVLGGAVMAVLLAADIAASAGMLAVMERQDGVRGVSTARLIASKYLSVFGRTV